MKKERLVTKSFELKEIMVKLYDSHTDTISTESRTIPGYIQDSDILTYARKNYEQESAYVAFAKVEATRNEIRGMSETKFMEIAKKVDTRTSTRERMVTRTVISYNVTYKFFNIEKSALETKSVTMGLGFDESKALAILGKKFNGISGTVVQVVSTEKVESLYEMKESEFIENSEIVER